MPDYYALLGIFRDATQEEIKRAYFEAAQRLHPDKNEAPGETEIFLDVQQAYDVLSNTEIRAEYDASLAPEEEEQSLILQRVFHSRESLVRINETQLIYALVEWKPRQNEREVVSPPLNICLVLDNSTSMKGQNVEMVKAAAIHLIRSLRQQDILSVVTFNDKAEVRIPASLNLDRRRMETKVRMLLPSGGTEIFQGLQAGVVEVRKNLSDERVNHIILLTDGQTYGDEEECLVLAEEAEDIGIGISGLGIGKDWNDDFLDELAAKTGSSSRYIAEPQEIQEFLEEKFEQLAKVFAENVELEFQTPSAVDLSYIFRLQPNAAHLSSEKELQLGVILRDQSLSLILEFSINPAAVLEDKVDLLTGSLKFEIPSQSLAAQPMRVRISRNVTEQASLEPPSPTLVHALANLNLYRMQETAQEDVASGKYNEASRRLQHLATHLLSNGERSMAKTVLLEAENLQQQQSFSEEGRKNIKYGTRALLLPAGKGK
ncbi:MAG: VWA domain-containing protein [Anaerolineae bacterium]|nr:VWA domain-containing protein [Anaerolineae bacterium]MBT3711819.1 VWA domain-containing protein [Anaerolineae bacterium]MBT4312333.1 VWA domain-containing protein [Anaerolineae bacterium]MBT4457353.1 VWA domain-containing protein [Anaerolineae bacterium]MBT4842896.1 VWA domain-containing protein [Anaerolineae bacterium]